MSLTKAPTLLQALLNADPTPHRLLMKSLPLRESEKQNYIFLEKTHSIPGYMKKANDQALPHHFLELGARAPFPPALEICMRNI